MKLTTGKKVLQNYNIIQIMWQTSFWRKKRKCENFHTDCN